MLPLSARADETFQCESGPDQAIVNLFHGGIATIAHALIVAYVTT